MKCEELFQQKDLWQENAFNKIKESLLSVRDNPLLRYDTMRKKYLVVIYGKSQIGKSTLILNMIGIRDKCFPLVYKTLRAKVPKGNSSTSTAIIYSKSDTEDYGLAVAPLNGQIPEKQSYTADELSQKLEEMRSRVEQNKEADDLILFIDIPRSFFVEDPTAEDIMVMDMPGVESRNQKEKNHVEALMRRYIPIAQVCIVACSANKIQSLEDTELPGELRWREMPEQYVVVTTSSYSQGTIKDYFRKPATARDKSFYQFVKGTYNHEVRGYLGEGSRMEIFPVDLGDSLQRMHDSLKEKPADAKEVLDTKNRVLAELRNSIVKRRGQRFMVAIKKLRDQVKIYGEDRLGELDAEIAEKDRVLESNRQIICGAEKYKKERESRDIKELRNQRKDHIRNMMEAKKQLSGKAKTFGQGRLEVLNDQVQRLIETEYLYSIGGKYLSDRSCAQKVNLSDKMVLSKILEYLEEEIEKKYLPECESWLKKADVDISISVESIWQRVEQEIYDYAYPRYYPKRVSLFHREKVLWDDVKYINHDVIHKAEELLGGYEDDWCEAIEKKLVPECAQESREDELLRKQDEKIRRAKEAMKIPQWEKEELQRERQKTEDLMHDDQNRLKEYVGKAEEAYREQRSDILKRVANSCKAEDKMALVLLLWLLDEDYRKTMGGFWNGNKCAGNGCAENG